MKKQIVPIKTMASFFVRFMTGESISGVVLIIAAAAALILANSTSAASYYDIIHMKLSMQIGGATVTTTLLHLVNDALMAVFFLVVGLEIKREILRGELSTLKKALLPATGALGGMIVPIVLYAAINAGRESSPGWGIPMATDIAFSLGILYLLGNRVPLSLKIFLSALAIVDDLGAVVVIAFFYCSGIVWIYVGAFTLVMIVLFFMNRLGIRNIPVYLTGGILLWICMMFSGIHSSIAGVALAAVIPSSFEKDRYGGIWSPSQKIEDILHPVVLYFIMPVFAFSNAGVAIQGTIDTFFNPATLGVIIGLLAGKPLGIFAFSIIAIKTGLCDKPRGADVSQFLGVAVLGGIGFTMSLFIAGLSFPDGSVLSFAKTGIITGSVLSALAGIGILVIHPRLSFSGHK